jgi:hypothetical protein
MANEDCMLCNQEIAHSICFKCLGDVIKIWLVSKDPRLVRVLEGNDFLLKCYNRNSKKCISCSNEINVCIDCYTYEVKELLALYEPKLTEEFNQLFGITLQKRR